MFYVCSSFGALQKLYGASVVCTIDDAEFTSMLALENFSGSGDTSANPVIVIVVTPDYNAEEQDEDIQFGSVSILSCSSIDSDWTEHFACKYSVSVTANSDAPSGFSNRAIPSSGEEFGSKQIMYEKITASGFHYGPAFQWMQRVCETAASGELVVDLALSGEAASSPAKSNSVNIQGVLNPALLDASLHGCIIAGLHSRSKYSMPGEIQVPRRLRSATLWGKLPENDAKQWTSEITMNSTDSSCDVLLRDEEGRLIVSIDMLQSATFNVDVLKAILGHNTNGDHVQSRVQYLLNTVWKPSSLDDPAPSSVQFPSTIKKLLVVGGISAGVAPSSPIFRTLRKSFASVEFVTGFSEDVDAHKRKEEFILEGNWDVVLCTAGFATRHADPIKINASILTLLQVLHRKHDLGSSIPALRVLTQNAQAIAQGEYDGPSANETSAGLWGLIKSAGWEMPWADISCVDVSADDDIETIASSLVREIHSHKQLGGQNCVWRHGKRYEARAEPISIAAQGDMGTGLSLSSGTIVISGGTGALGLLSAKMLLLRGANRVVLLSRSGRPAVPKLWEELSTNTEYSGKVEIIRCDVTSYSMIKGILRRESVRQNVVGILHCAGIPDVGLLVDQTAAQLKKVWDPKVGGALNLERALKELHSEPHFFVLFSSTSSFLGNAGQSNYAAANSALDAIACRTRKHTRIVATSIQWGPWAEIGMAAGVDFKDSAARGLSNEEGMKILWNIIDAGASSPPVIAAAGFKMHALEKVLSFSRNNKMIEMGTHSFPSHERGVSSKVERTIFTKELAGMNFDDAEARLVDEVKSILMDISKGGDSVAIDDDASLESIGLGSLGSVELRNRLLSLTGLKMSTTIAYEHSTLRALAVHVLTKLDLSSLEYDDDREAPARLKKLNIRKLSQQKEIHTHSNSRVMLPSDSNSTGIHVHGGTILKMIEETGFVASLKYVCRSNIINGTVALVRVNRAEFIAPIYVGEISRVDASVRFSSGRSSIVVEARVFAENLYTGVTRLTNTAQLYFVALDATSHKPISVPALRTSLKLAQRYGAQYSKLRHLKLQKQVNKEVAHVQTRANVEQITRNESNTACTAWNSEKRFDELNLPSSFYEAYRCQHGDCTLGSWQIVCGGVMMKLADGFASFAALNYCKKMVSEVDADSYYFCVTTSIDACDFSEPVYTGELLHISRIALFPSRQGIKVKIQMEAEDELAGSRRHCVQAVYNFSPIDRSGKTQPVPLPKSKSSALKG